MPEYFDEEEHQRTKQLVEEEYDDFIRSGLEAGFTDEQVDWLWENCRRTCTQ